MGTPQTCKGRYLLAIKGLSDFVCDSLRRNIAAAAAIDGCVNRALGV